MADMMRETGKTREGCIDQRSHPLLGGFKACNENKLPTQKKKKKSRSTAGQMPATDWAVVW